jgi:hypothetical protein
MLVKKVHKYSPLRMFEGFIAIESIERMFEERRIVKITNAKTLIIIKRVFKLIEPKKLFLLGLT